MLTIQQLRVLLAIRDHGSLSRAAAELRYGVPTVAHHLDALEGHLGARLVERTPRGTDLTPLGELFAREAQHILRRVEQAERMVARQREAGVATLRVGTFASFGARFLPAAIDRLRAEYPITVEISEAEPTRLVHLVEDGEVDAALIYDFADDPLFGGGGLRLTRLLDEPFRVMVAAHGPLAAQEVLDLRDLRTVAWVSSRSDDEASGRTIRRACRSAGYEPRELMRTDDLAMIHGLVAQRLGIALATEIAVDPRFDVTLRPALQDLGFRRILFATRPGPLLPAVERLRTILQELISEAAAG